MALVSAEDAPSGKPDPAMYRLALARINEAAPRLHPVIQPAECLVVEDSLAGIQSALAAGMTVVGLATTYPTDQLTAAHLVLPGLDGVSLERRRVSQRPAPFFFADVTIEDGTARVWRPTHPHRPRRFEGKFQSQSGESGPRDPRSTRLCRASCRDG